MMKKSSEAERRKITTLTHWENVAATTRKPIECAFGMLKNKFKNIQAGVRSLHDDALVRIIRACLVLRNGCVDSREIDDKYYERNDYALNDIKDEILTTETNDDKKK